MDAERKKAIVTISLIVLVIAAIVLVFTIRSGGSKPPKLTVSNELGQKITAQQGTYTWKSGSSSIAADSRGPLGLYVLGELKGIEPSENDDLSLSLQFGAVPQTVNVVIYPESAAATEDYEAGIRRDVTGSRCEYRTTVPQDGVYIVNNARAGLMDEQALREALRSGKLGGLALDVFHQEPIKRDDELFNYPNVVLTPHIAGAGRDVIYLQSVMLVNDLLLYFAGGRPRPIVNPEVFDRKGR